MSENRVPSLGGLAPANAARFFKDPFPMLQRGFDELGPIFSIKMSGFGAWVFVAQPELIQQLFKAPPDQVIAGELNRRLLGAMLGADATFSLDGQAHLDRRRMVQPHFNGRKAREQVSLISRVTRRSLATWPTGETLKLLPRAHHMSLEILVHYLFSASPRERREELVETFDRFACEGLRSWLLHVPPLQIDLGPRSPWGRILEMRRQTREQVRAFVAERRGDREGFGDRDIASEIVNTEHRDGGYLEETSLVDELINVVFAGHETTGTILSWAVECVARRPEVLEALRREREEVLGDSDLEPEHLRHLPYLDSVIKEVVRYRPLAPMAGLRLIKEPFTLGGFDIEPGTVVTQCFPAMTRHPEIFDGAETFDPQHFFERRFGPYEWNPFGGGRRMCLGKGLAEVELAVFLTEIFSTFDIELAQASVQPTRDGFFFAPSRGLEIKARPRR